MRYLISTVALALCFAATTVQALPVTASSVTYDSGGVDLTVTPTGPTNLNLTAGESLLVLLGTGLLGAVISRRRAKR